MTARYSLILVVMFFASLLNFTQLAAQPKDSIATRADSSITQDSGQYVNVDETPASAKANLIDENALKSEGNWLISIPRGMLGMGVLILIAYLFSSKRSAIKWRLVGIGLSIQLVLALGILKIALIRNGFEFVGKIFVVILDFTREGSAFLFGNLLDIDSVGYIFALQILPTIIFFSALTSLLFT